MALISCVKCGKQISDKCTKCTHCGHEDEEQIENAREIEDLGEQHNDMTRAQRILRLEWHVAFVLALVSFLSLGFLSWIHGYYMCHKLRWKYLWVSLGIIFFGLIAIAFVFARRANIGMVFGIIDVIALLTLLVMTIMDMIKLLKQRNSSDYKFTLDCRI